MKQQKDGENVLRTLISREYYPRNCLKKNLKVLRTLVCRGNYEFKKVWERSSKQLICCESNTIFLDNYKTAYGGYGCHNSAPVHKFSINPTRMPRKIVDAILSRSKPSEIRTKGTWTGRPGNKMYGITADTLVVIDLNTGRLGCEHLLLLSNTIKFKHIGWYQVEESFVLSTTLSHRPSPPAAVGSTQRPRLPNLVKIMALFNILPIAFVCMFEVTRKVFGSDVMNAMMSQGLLVIMHLSRAVKLYDFNGLLQKHQIEPYPMANASYGQRAPLSMNLTITELPQLLFVARCEEWNVQIGGFPWHYLVTPVGYRGCFNVYSIKSEEMAENGSIQSDGHSIEFDRAIFHPDDSSRVVHIGPDDVRVYWVKQKEDSEESVLTPAFTINLQYSRLQSPESLAPIVTSSGRQVKRRFSMDEILGTHMCTTIHEVDYEDEIDVLSVCHTVHKPNALQGTLGIYHNVTGRLLRSVTLNEPWPDYSEHTVTLDKDTITHIIKSPSGKFLCQVYRLFERCHDNNNFPKPSPGGAFEDSPASNFSAPEHPPSPSRHRRRAAVASRRRGRRR